MSDLVTVSLGILGCQVKDKVTGFTGVVSAVCFDLYGCIQAIVAPAMVLKEETGEPILPESRYFDIHRLSVTSAPVMQQPLFESLRGPSEKPAPRA
jgi:hypothetical protein